ncbi:unnamed protein product [Cylindrotheca closterium]|uniref:Ribosomal RNA-processing protein 14/surfeit locus protein 6 C-terminal domain-containing protein n=1 Tax=Cylindrotheca closterium TaxID=2856 RepID=A0AAD2FK05_9STRA|nr:unnamed protein product [Cylindrotheca closterium]
MAPKISQHQLLQELQDNNEFFDNLVDIIPAKLYVAGNSGDDYNPKYYKGQAKESKEARRAQNKQAKRAKLDPSRSESTTQLKNRLEGGRSVLPATPESAATKPINKNKKSQKNDEDVTSAPPPASADPSKMDNSSRIEALRAKLHAKLAEKRGQRPSDPNVVSKRAARRAEKAKRKEEAKARKKSSTSKAENSSKTKGYSVQDSIKSAAAVAEDLARLDYGRLAGLNTNPSDNYSKVNKSLANMNKTKNLQKLLADAEAKKTRLEELKKGNTEEKQKAENIVWGDTLKEATGERVKDDPAKLRKALKKRDAKKKKSSKAWKSRMDQTKEKMDERQKIRNHNLSKRKLGGSSGANLSSKRIATEEEGKKSRAGFEGRKQGFLNSSSKKDQQ